MHSARKRLGVEVFVPEEELDSVPSCPHGPMLMFERYFESKPSRKFYSCSAFRDRKDCSFFQWVDENVSDVRKEAHTKIVDASRAPFNSHQCWKRLQIIQGITESERSYCETCNQLLLPKEHKKHKDHGITCGISDKNLACPSRFLPAFEKKQTFAQYLFADSTVDFFLRTFQRLGFQKLVCIGAPRIHEAVQSKEFHNLKGMDSILLDLDNRYAQFNDENHFIHYNMFNHHFFDKDAGKTLLRNFFQNSTPKSIAVVMDPPFGGLVQVIATSLRKMWKFACKDKETAEDVELATFWIFPYFMEAHIIEQVPSFAMCDYRVAYDNHPLYKKHQSEGSKTSPVRIFTNIPARKIVLPEDEGYRYCKQCERYVIESNVHCEECNNCTSKDGRAWVHCEQCKRCVKQGRVHCQTCNRCEAVEHNCERSVRGCHVCGDIDHKRRHCPKKLGKDVREKRKQSQTKSSTKNKRRKISKE